MARLCYIIGLLCWGFSLAGNVLAQQPRLDSGTTLRTAFTNGVVALEAGHDSLAVPPLEAVFRADPGYALPERGAVAYWLGRVRAAEGRTDEALDVWAEGLEALEARSRFDVRLADAFIRHVFEGQEGLRYARAAAAYLQLLRRIDEGALAPEERTLTNEHLAALTAILPEAVRQETGLVIPEEQEEEDQEEPLRLLPLEDGAGARLVTWWHSQDALPSTSENERLEEHLERFVYAWTHYTKDGRLDDRGHVYIRLGPPYKITSVDFNSSTFRRKVLNRYPTITAFGYPSNEFWIYPHVDYAAHYLFIEKRQGRYRLGEPVELLPSTLQRGFTPSPRGLDKSRAYVRSMVEVYRQLALYHQDYSTLYQEVANYAGLLDVQEFTGQPMAPFHPTPSTFAQSMLAQGRAEGYQIARRRKEVVPQSYSRLREDVPALPLEVRLARFLEPDGTTRTEIYWSAPIQALYPSGRLLEAVGRERAELPEQYLLSFSMTQHAANYRERATTRERHLVADAPAEPTALLMPQTLTTHGDTGLFHLAVQWDEYMVYPREEEEDPLRVGPLLKSDTFRADSLSALTSDEGTLEMSDLKPLLLTSDTDPAAAPPYPFPTVTPETPLALYFEVYHLGFDREDRTRYRVEYALYRRTEQGGLLRFFKEDEETQTTTQTTYTGQRRTAREYIVLDLSPGEDEAATGTLTVSVRVTDETTGQSVERSIAFDLAAAPEDDAGGSLPSAALE